LGLWLAVLFLVGRRLIHAVTNLPRDGLCGPDLAVVALIAYISLIVTGLTVDVRFFDFANALVMLLIGAAIGYVDRHGEEVRRQ
ncbi:MAG: O-antigen ligase family protein, partial [Actinobacteria bacterium]|nr:O-antigen ligase family protein [Actinomycetota bacterium]